MWLWSTSLKFESRTQRLETKQLEHTRKRTFHEAAKEKAKRDAAEIPLIIDKKRRALDRKLKNALKTPAAVKGEL